MTRLHELVMELAKAHLAPVYPFYFPVNWEDCYAAMLAHCYMPRVVLVDPEESREYIILDCIRWFDDQKVAREFLAALPDARLRFFAQQIRARTNLLTTMGRPLVRSARVELLREFPRSSGSSGGCAEGLRLDHQFRVVWLQYNGTVD